MAMRVKILKPFPYYADGVTQSNAAADSIEDIPDALVQGLRAAGYVALIPAEPKTRKHSELDGSNAVPALPLGDGSSSLPAASRSTGPEPVPAARPERRNLPPAPRSRA